MAEEPAVDFGTFLRQAREKRGVSLQQVAATTKISARVLDALERNDPRKLPGGIFSRAFVRSYAREVGLDPEVAVEQFVAAFPEQATAESTPTTVVLDDPETFESRRRAATTFLQLLGVSLVIVVIVVIYYGMRRSEPPPVRVVSEAAPEQRDDAARAPAAAGGAGAAAQGAPAARQAGRRRPAAASSGLPARHWRRRRRRQRRPPRPAAAAADRRAADDRHRRQRRVLAGADGRRHARASRRTLEPGEHVSYPVRTFVTINAGNAGALSLTLNGKPAKPIGTAGQVVTDHDYARHRQELPPAALTWTSAIGRRSSTASGAARWRRTSACSRRRACSRPGRTSSSGCSSC